MTTAAKAQQSLVDTEQEAQAPWTSQTDVPKFTSC